MTERLCTLIQKITKRENLVKNITDKNGPNNGPTVVYQVPFRQLIPWGGVGYFLYHLFYFPAQLVGGFYPQSSSGELLLQRERWVKLKHMYLMRGSVGA